MAVPIQRFQRKFAISKVPQADYATPTAGAANFKQVLAKGDSFATEQPNIADNRDYAKGTRQATEQWITNHDSGVTLPFDICSEEIGRFLLLAFGKVVSSQPDAGGNPTVWQHVFTGMNPLVSAQIPVTTFIEQCGAAIDALFPSMACQALSLRGEGPQRLEANYTGVGSGKKVTPSGIVIPALADLHYLYQAFVGLTLDNAGAITNAATAPQRLNSWEFGVNNTLGLDDGFRPGAAAYQTANTPESGEVRSEALLQDQAYAMRFNLRLLSDSAFLAELTAQAPIVPIFDIVGPTITGIYKHRLHIKGYRAPYRTIGKTTRNGLVTLDIEPNILFDTATSKDVEVTLTNTIASYTV
jgi:hypothetical protein